MAVGPTQRAPNGHHKVIYLGTISNQWVEYKNSPGVGISDLRRASRHGRCSQPDMDSGSYRQLGSVVVHSFLPDAIGLVQPFHGVHRFGSLLVAFLFPRDLSGACRSAKLAA